jgi:hypothetical protein
VLAGAVERDEVCLMRRGELGLLAAQPALGLGDLHALACARANQVGLELSDHGQHVGQQPPDRIGRVVHRAAEVSLTCRRVSSSAIARAPGSDRASRSSLVTTSSSPARQAASARRSPGRSRLVPVKPWST